MHAQHPGSSGEPNDWDNCILCQKVTPEVLQCPARLKHGGVAIGRGYSTLSSSIISFIYLDELWVAINIARLDKVSGLEAPLLEHKASGTNCAILNLAPWSYSEQQRRKLQLAIVTRNVLLPKSTPTQKIIINGTHKTSRGRCLYCEASSASEPLHEVTTLQVDTWVCNYSHASLHERLLAKPSARDMIAQVAK